VASQSSPYYKLIDRYVVHPGHAPLAARVAQVIPEDAEYVVFDLDRTVHLGVTIGERLGWEILCDPRCIGIGSHADGLDPIFSVRKPVRTLKRFGRGVRYWSLPGLFYAATVRLGDRWRAWDRLCALTLGAGYVNDVQAVLRSILMASTAGYTREEVRTYTERAWRRSQPSMVVDAEVIDAVRRHCRRLKAIILSSASTAPTVEHAASVLGVDGFVSSAVDLYSVDDNEVFSAPLGIPRWLRRGRPRFFSRPGAVVHNSADNKVNFLRVHFPEVFSPASVSVGISDNNYGEDCSWPDHFDHVVALNTRHPFSPFIRSSSPCRTIHSVDATPVAGEAWDRKRFGWLGTLRAEELGNGELLRRLLGGEHDRLESLYERLRGAREHAARAADGSLRQRVANTGMELARTVDTYNRSADKHRKVLARDLYSLDRQLRRVRAQLERARRECARICHEAELLHDHAARTVAVRHMSA
jgi:hypothetical protein